MELQFQKKSIRCLQQLKWEILEQEQTQQVRLEESLPDIERIICAWGQVLIRSKQWNRGEAGISGGVMVWVLYQPEGQSEPVWLDTWVPFQSKWDLPDTQTDGTLLSSACIKTVDVRSTSARKLVVRVVLTAEAEAVVQGQIPMWEPQDVPDDVMLLRRNYSLQLPLDAGEKPFLVEECLEAPKGQVVKELLRWQVQPEIMDKKVIGSRMVFRGNVLLHILYITADGTMETTDYQLPFSQFAELQDDYGDDPDIRLLPVITGAELEKDEMGRLNFKADLVGQYMISGPVQFDAVEDAYSPYRPVTLIQESINLPSMTDLEERTITAEMTRPVTGVDVIDTEFYPYQGIAAENADGTFLSVAGHFQCLHRNENGMLDCASGHWQDTVPLGQWPASSIRAAVSPAGKARGEFTPELTMTGQMLLKTVALAEQEISAVTGLELGEITVADPNRPSIILRRAGTESLWQIAKQTGSSVEAILQANGITAQPNPEKMLLIPVL